MDVKALFRFDGDPVEEQLDLTTDVVKIKVIPRKKDGTPGSKAVWKTAEEMDSNDDVVRDPLTQRPVTKTEETDVVVDCPNTSRVEWPVTTGLERTDIIEAPDTYVKLVCVEGALELVRLLDEQENATLLTWAEAQELGAKWDANFQLVQHVLPTGVISGFPE